MADHVTFEILHRVADAFARRDVDGIVESFAEDGEFVAAVGTAHGRAGIEEFVDRVNAALPPDYYKQDLARQRALSLAVDDPVADPARRYLNRLSDLLFVLARTLKPGDRVEDGTVGMIAARTTSTKQ